MYSPSLTFHLSHLETVFQILSTNSIRVKLSKCSFGQTTIDYLGHSISEHGIAVDSFEIQAIIDWPQPTSLKSLWGFLGLTGYYRKFVRSYDLIAKSLTNMLKQGNFFWTTDSLTTFTSLSRSGNKHIWDRYRHYFVSRWSPNHLPQQGTIGSQSRSSHLRQRNAIGSQSYDDTLQTFHMLN